MGRMVDELYTAPEAIWKDGDLIINEEFMMVILQGIMDDIYPFEKYCTHMFQNNSMTVVG